MATERVPGQEASAAGSETVAGEAAKTAENGTPAGGSAARAKVAGDPAPPGTAVTDRAGTGRTDAERTAGGPAGTGAAQPGQPAGPGERILGWGDRFVALLSRNLIFCVALLLGAFVRVIVMLGYRPAMMIRLDSFFYLLDTTRTVPDPDNTSGYPFLLWILKPAHSLALVAGLQHLMGLGIAVLAYAIMRRYRVPGWGATLATLPVLFDARELMVEHAIMADTLATLLMIGSLAVLLLGERWPSVWRPVTAGLLMGLATLVRPTTLPLIILVPLYLLVARFGWRRALATLVAGLVPVAGYAVWFFASYGVIDLSNSNGLFLWARTMTFANCAVIKPPPDLKPLCRSHNHGKPGVAVSHQTPQDYLWSRRDWPWLPKQKGYEIYQVAFTPAKNSRAQKFAIAAIEAQPVDYAKVVIKGIGATFLHTDHAWRFPTKQPRTPSGVTELHAYEVTALRRYLGNTAGLSPYLSRWRGTRLQQPYAHLISEYEKLAIFPGVLFLLVFAVGLAGMFFRRSRSAAAALLWVAAVIVLVLPIAENQYNYRYALPAVPLACMAAALVLTGRRADSPPAGQPEATGN